MSERRRFVLLLHETDGEPRPTHWDLMIEDGEALAAWALQDDPRMCVEQLAEQLAPHRRHYLDYEGPISGGRGAVQQCEAGKCEVIEQSAAFWRIQFSEERWAGELQLARQSDARWSACFVGSMRGGNGPCEVGCT